jgi:uncharacterized membrane protein
MISSELLSISSMVFGWSLYCSAVLWALWRAPWVELFSDSLRQHLFYGTVFSLFLLWMMRHDTSFGLSFQLMGMTAATLLLSWPLAILAGLGAQLALLMLGLQDFVSLGINAVLMVLLPVLIAENCARWVEHFEPRNLFVYIFCSAFFPAGVTSLLCSSVGLSLLWFEGFVQLPFWMESFAGYLWLLAFPEAFINGMVISALVVFQPNWLDTFNHARYLQAPWKDEN